MSERASEAGSTAAKPRERWRARRTRKRSSGTRRWKALLAGKALVVDATRVEAVMAFGKTSNISFGTAPLATKSVRGLVSPILIAVDNAAAGRHPEKGGPDFRLLKWKVEVCERTGRRWKGAVKRTSTWGRIDASWFGADRLDESASSGPCPSVDGSTRALGLGNQAITRVLVS